MWKNVSEFCFETGIIRRANEASTFSTFEIFFLKRVQDKLQPVFDS